MNNYQVIDLETGEEICGATVYTQEQREAYKNTRNRKAQQRVAMQSIGINVL